MVLAFGDIRGFGSWTYRASNSMEVQEPFIQIFYQVMQSFVKEKDIYFKYLGDGMMIGKEMTLSERRNGGMIQFLKDIQLLTRESTAVVHACEWPPPEGFRMRIMGGYVHKLMVLDPNDTERKRCIPEYVGYLPNTVQRLLEVSPQTTCLIHENIVKPIGVDRHAFNLTKFGTPSESPRGVNREDLEALYILGL